MTHYEIQIAPHFSSYFEDDRYGSGTILNKLTCIVNDHGGSIVIAHQYSAILEFQKDEDAADVSKILTDWLAPRMFIDMGANVRSNRYKLI